MPTLTRLHILQQHATPMSIASLLEALPFLSYELLRKTLQRMTRDHQILNPQRAFYTLPTPIFPSPVPDSVSQPAVPNPPPSQLTTSSTADECPISQPEVPPFAVYRLPSVQVANLNLTIPRLFVCPVGPPKIKARLHLIHANIL